MKGIDFSLQVNNARKYASCLASVDPENPLLNYMNYEFPDFPALFERYETHDMPEAVHMYVLEMKEAYETLIEKGSSLKKDVARRQRAKQAAAQ